ncbi:hypothetical protein DSO57_1013631 [Entomophthora muscae]|uniref:Uncharacterized protein n=1 Tax=Entomophthora muscae TaxID=34485 RepID=A0ACC2T5P4_9FUNG|nr:hypothetical protein DSO57_1013631 [Entomophthora muscae]
MIFLFFCSGTLGGLAFGISGSVPLPRELQCSQTYMDIQVEGMVDPRCRLKFTNSTFPLPSKLSPHLIRSLHHDNRFTIDRKTSIVSENLKWSGQQSVSEDKGCFEYEQCWFHIYPHKLGCHVSFHRKWIGPTNHTLQHAVDWNSRTSTLTFRGPNQATLLQNQIGFELKLMKKVHGYSWCIFCSPEITKLWRPAIYNHLPVGIFSLTLTPLSQR